MHERTHALTGRLALHIYKEISGNTWNKRQRELMIKSCVETDALADVEFVNVESSRDDPHHKRWLERNDIAHTATDGHSHTAFNHFIDIRKGPGRFDDYDGYSYCCGSASRDQYQPAKQAARGWSKVFAACSRMKVDEALSYWFNDEYVHVPGHRWYRGCSPAMERYSFPSDLHRFASKRQELAARFPLASAQGQAGQGVPCSVFMPVDNLARYWFGKHVRHGKAEPLGYVLHAVGDASVPHHAAGCNGNWHGDYEEMLADFAAKLSSQRAFHLAVGWQASRWLRQDPKPPRRRLSPADVDLVPALNWSVPQLITWLALHAYAEYTITYQDFRSGLSEQPRSLYKLFSLATTMAVLVLAKAQAASKRGDPKD